jgi:hypothetical protein
MTVQILKQTETLAVVKVSGSGGTINLATDLLSSTMIIQGTPTVNITFAHWNISQNSGDKIAINRGVGVPEVARMTGVSGMIAGQTFVVAGLTYTSTALTTQAQLLGAFAGLLDGAITGPGTATGIYSGALTGYTTSAVVSNVVTFTSTAAPSADVSDLTSGGTAAASATITVTTQGQAPGNVNILNLQANGNILDLSGNGGLSENTESTSNLVVTISGLGEVYLTLRKQAGYASKIEPERFGQYDNPNTVGV